MLSKTFASLGVEKLRTVAIRVSAMPLDRATRLNFEKSRLMIAGGKNFDLHFLYQLPGQPHAKMG